MKKLLFSSLLFLTVTCSTYAEEWELFPKISSKPDYGLAFLGGSSSLHKHDSSGDLYGLELSFVCPLVKASEHTIRQQVSLTKFNKNNLDIYSLEFNPHYLYQLEEHTYFGMGPSLGIAKIEGDDTLTTFGLGISIRKDLTEKLFLGGEFRKVYATDSDFSNDRILFKVGYHF